mmetsp:Transcript_24972/g.35988  ORF Transcript_24972/g.35988 Transcript_24972/m.35988 type:complete len:103 (-) Transcript_24972:504-812(-)
MRQDWSMRLKGKTMRNVSPTKLQKLMSRLVACLTRGDSFTWFSRTVTAFVFEPDLLILLTMESTRVLDAEDDLSISRSAGLPQALLSLFLPLPQLLLLIFFP